MSEIVDFQKAKREDKSNRETDVETRILNCYKNEDCACKYCTYKEGAAKMMVDFLASDVMQHEQNTGSKFATFDLKEVFFKAIHEIKKMEKEFAEEEEND